MTLNVIDRSQTIMMMTKNLFMYEYWLPAHMVRLLDVHSMTVSRLLKL